jgi:hypothetical protein
MRSNMRKRGERGNVVVEFALVTVFLVPVLISLAGVGMSLGDSIRVSQTVRDTAHMFARGVQFDDPQSQALVARLGGQLGLTAGPGGNGTVILSKVMTPRQGQCVAAGRGNNCPNRDTTVFIHRVHVGNDWPPSRFGTPAPGLANARGNINADNYLSHPSVRAPDLQTVLATAGIVQGEGDVAYVVEGFFQVPTLRLLGPSTSEIYCKYIF